ncbi:Nif3-like dinuclear metal center hexameric protein [Campylobacter sp. US33a]|uniref:Nif3-like dinuclear metal center hexameric protein n=1 Tax=Campylobacter sp. US33a TaxID=2498120 RepID=UPI001067C1AB|nr:Nif3-like dinuclear metal center hexameric protein [Campylobacter sp. US33a]TEY01546.1 Nif3-like dinuclear metal center hexameric protein [Campylobacter sp. US33a]
MKLSEIYHFLDKISPFDTQESWDNSGLLLGNLNDEISKVYVSLDVDKDLLLNAEENSLFITHHPLIFKGLKHLSGEKYPNELITLMIKKNIALICMHTNYDLSHLNTYFVEEILGFKITYRDNFIAYVDMNIDFWDLVSCIKQSLKLDVIKTSFCGKTQIQRIGICTGSGGDLICNVDADCFISGDFKYHQAFECLHNNLNLIDVGHFESERYFANSLAKELQNLSLKAIISVSKNPFQYF